MNKADVRRFFPECVAFADECRRVFGDGVKLVHASESGQEIGKASVIDPDQVVNLRDMVVGSFDEDVRRERRRGK